jgi:hypothetical protein
MNKKSFPFEYYNSYFHMSSAVRSLFRYEAEIWARGVSQVLQNRPNTWKLTAHEYWISNIFRVRLGKVLKNINLLYILTDVKLGI